MNRRLLALGASAILLAVPATADAAITVGSNPDAVIPSTPLQSCDDGCTLVQDERFYETLRVPSAGDTPHGVITSWRIYGGDGEARLRRLSPDAATALASGPWSALAAGGGVAQHAVELPVVAGDAIGVDLSPGATIAADSFGLGSDTVLRWIPALADGATRPGEALDGEIYVQFTVEPDRNQDGRGDESQPPADPPPPPPPYEPPPHQPPPNDPPRSVPPRSDPPSADPPVQTGPRTGPSVPRSGPRVTIARRATASGRGVVSYSLANPYGARLTGTVSVRRGRARLGTAKVRVAADGTRLVKVKLDRSGARAVARGGSVKVSLAAKLRGPTGRARTTRATVTVSRGIPVEPRRAPTGGDRTGDGGRTGGGGRTGDDAGFDGTYRASDGLTMVVQSGRVLSFSGSITTYCTRSSKQKNVAFGMFGDDPDPTVAPDGSFAYEATRGYGMVKLTYRGRISGGTASGNLAVEDRSPLLGTGRIEFDYCFAGKDWSASK